MAAEQNKVPHTCHGGCVVLQAELLFLFLFYFVAQEEQLMLLFLQSFNDSTNIVYLLDLELEPT
jgi:hypothetical protein